LKQGSVSIKPLDLKTSGPLDLFKVLKSSCLAVLISLAIFSIAYAKEYDGLFFMGFNLHKDVFNDKNVRYAVNYAIDRKYIANDIMSEEVVPNGIIPPGMEGYSPTLEGFSFDPKKAKKLLKKPLGIELALLHTDGLKTVQIAEKIKSDLAAVGIKVKTKMVDYSDQDKWEAELKSGRHHLFLMGYKAGFIDPTAEVSTTDLIEPLFGSDGSANFTYYENQRVDNLINQVIQTDKAIAGLRQTKLLEINKIILKDAPTINLFYISKL